MTKSKVIKSASIVGIVKYMRHDPDEEPKCICCPGEPAHIFSRNVDFGLFNSAYPEHFGFGANEFIGTHVLYGGYEGKRVRLTVEVLEDEYSSENTDLPW